MFLHYTPEKDYVVNIDGFCNPLTSTIINVFLSIFTVFRFINTRLLANHYIFQVGVNMNCCTAASRELLTTLSVSLLFAVMLTS